MKILKFGGTSVANSTNIKSVFSIIDSQKTKTVVVVSALGGVTDLLFSALNFASQKESKFIELINETEKRHLEIIDNNIPVNEHTKVKSFLREELNQLKTILDGIKIIGETTTKTTARVLGFGEYLSSSILFEVFKNQGLDIVLKDSRDLIETHIQDNRSSVNWEATTKKVKDYFNTNKAKITLVPGFIAKDGKGRTSILGRGGSDFSASIFANILEVDILEIWTDVSGIYTANPKLVSQATPIENLSYLEAMELSHFGAKVIYPPTLLPLIGKKIQVLVKNTFAPTDQGTLIGDYIPQQTASVIKGISHIDNISLITLEGVGMIGIPGFSKRLFEAISIAQISVVMITQASSEYSICIAIPDNYSDQAKQVIDDEFAFEIALKKVAPAHVENNMVNIAIVGDEMRNHQGISGKMFSPLGINNVNIRAIAQGASERNISIIIEKKDIRKALNVLHEAFFENYIKVLNLFVIGVGNVGNKLLEQIQKQEEYLEQSLRLRIRVIAISNSRKMLLDETGINIENYKGLLEKGSPANTSQFFDNAKALNLRNSIFVDNTASDLIASEYKHYLNNNISVVTCNKIACADIFDNYINLKQLSRKYGSSFLFETSVGAGLPVIDTLNNLVASGDRIIKIQAILSGSLNFIFNNFKEGVSFKDIVIQAQKEGYTEPDPKIDLSGVDVARKILILARESGLELELDDVAKTPFLPKECLETPDNESFFESLQANEEHFNNLLKSANSKNSRLKYVAQLENGKAKIGLQEISENHVFYNLEGSDNIILFYTNRYTNQPLIIKGAGAGAEVTASGIFADIIRIGKR